MGRRLALLIATYEYQDQGLRRLTAPAHDAEALAAVLADPDIAGFEVTTLINEPHHVVGEAIGDFYRGPRGDDLTLLYFTGHGLKDDHGRLYLAMTNTRRDSLLFTAPSGEQIDSATESCASRQKILILDCCYSGAYPAGRVAKADTQVHTIQRFQGSGRVVLTASDATQYSFEGDTPHGQAAQSVFTRHLVAGLRDGGADLNGDGDITLDELYSYVHDRVVAEMPQQRPKKQENVAGRIVIARNVNWALPPYLRHALDSPIPADRLNALQPLEHLYRIGNTLVRARVADEVRRLTDDDSRSVSTAATARLRSMEPATTPPDAEPPPRPAPARTPPFLAPGERPADPKSAVPPSRPAPGGPLEPATPRESTLEIGGTESAPPRASPPLTDRPDTKPTRPDLDVSCPPPPPAPLRAAPPDRRVAPGSPDPTGVGAVRTLKGHTNGIVAVAFTPDGKTLVTAGDRTVRLWQVPGGRFVGDFNVHLMADVRLMVLRPDGRTLATGSRDGTVRLWDTTAVPVPTIFTGRSGPVWSVAFSPDGRTLASGGQDRKVRLWDVAARRATAVLTGHTSLVFTVAFNSSGKMLASGGHDRTVRLWRIP